MADYFVSPGAGSNVTGNGSLATPWKTTQHALDNITQGASGDQINIQSGAADVLTGALSLSSYGTPTQVRPLVIRGYATAANDGGKGEIDGDGTYGIYTGGSANLHFIDMDLGNSGAAQMLVLSGNLHNCHIHHCSHNDGVKLTGINTACQFSYLSGLQLNGGASIGCHFDIGTWGYDKSIYSTVSITLIHCLITGVTTKAVNTNSNRSLYLYNNTIVCNATGSWVVSHDADGSGFLVAINNLIVGASGVGGVGIYRQKSGLVVLAGNAYYNCTTNESINGTGVTIRPAPAITLASDPFVNAAGGDYRVKPGSLAAGAAWPPSWPGLSSTTNARDIGAAQNALTIDYPVEADVRLGVDYAEAAKTGTLTVPVAGDVRAGIAVDNTTGTLGIPTVGNVRSGVQYGAANTEYTGVLELPLSGNVLTGVQYGASGTEYTGTMPQTLSIGEGAEIDIIDDLITVEVND